jgi:hypothetical protein
MWGTSKMRNTSSMVQFSIILSSYHAEKYFPIRVQCCEFWPDAYRNCLKYTNLVPKQSIPLSKTHSMWMWRWSSPSVCELRDNFKPRLAFQHWNGVNAEIRSSNKRLSDELDARKPSVVSITLRSEEFRLQNLVYNLTISNPGYIRYPTSTYYWTVPFILDHSYISLGTWEIQKLLKQKF